MIGRLQGILLEKRPPYLLIDVHGVGYELLASMNTCYQLPEVGQSVILYTHLVVREDAQLLYGFYEVQERTLFKALIKASGVGPKTALAILSSMDPKKFASCITQEDLASLVRIPGIGKKTAERLIVEMRDRLSDWEMAGEVVTAQGHSPSITAEHAVTKDAISALVTLGYKPQEASRAIGKISQKELSTEALIREALRNMA